MSDDFENDFENDYDAGFEGEDFESETVDSLHDSADAVSAAAAILMGEEPSGGSSRQGRSISITDVDASGKPDFSTNGREAEAPAYHGNRSAPDGSVAARLEQHTTNMRLAERAVADIQDRLANGELSQADAQQMMQYTQGYWAGNQIRALQAEMEQMQDQQWLSNQVEAVRREHADVWDDPEKRRHYQQKALEYLGSVGYSAEELSGAGAREMNIVLTMLKTQQENEKLKAENNRHRTQNRRRKQAQGRGRRDMQAGARTKNSASVTDEVAAILGASMKGGRRR